VRQCPLWVQSRSGDDRTAELLLLQSLALADEAGATGWSLRTAVSLAPLRRDAGREREATIVLAPVIARVVDGAGTKDFDDAQELLLQLSRRRTKNVRFWVMPRMPGPAIPDFCDWLNALFRDR
jgi:hypothetical protein